MALAYGDVKDIYDSLKEAGVVTQSLPEWSQEMNRTTNSDLYAAGLHDNFIKRSSHALDKLLESSGFVDIGREFGRGVGEAVGAPEAGAKVGAGLPRSVVNYGPLLIPGAGWGAAAARLGLTGALSGAETYTQTGSPAAGIISGATAAALPKIADIGEQAILKRLGGRLVEGTLATPGGVAQEQIARYFPKTIPQRIGSFGAGQAVAAGTIGLSQAAESLAQGEAPQNPFTVENLLGLTLGQAPFALLHLATKGRVSPADQLQKAIDLSTNAIELRQAREAAAAKAPMEEIPLVEQREVPIDVLAETEQRLAQVRGEQVKIQDDPNIPAEEKLNRINGLLQQEASLLKQKAVTTGDSILGDSITPTSPRDNIVGRQIKTTTRRRTVYVDDLPENPEELRGKIVSYPTEYEPTPTQLETGAKRYSLPEAQWRTIKTVDEWQSRGRKIPDVNQPELPTQPREPTQEEMFGHITDLKEAQTQIDVAQTPAELHAAITKINDVKDQVGLAPTNDAKLRQTADVIDKSGLVPPDEVVKVAAKVEAQDAERHLTQQEAGHISALFGESGEGPRGFHIITPGIPKETARDVETKPVSDVVTDVAFAAITRKPPVDAESRKDAQDFVDLVENFGTTRVDPTVAAKFLNDRLGTVGWDAKEVKAFLEKPHVTEWQNLLETGLSRVVSRGPQPRVVQVINGEEPFTPQTSKDTDVMTQMGIAQGGKGLLTYLQNSDNPLVKSLADDLAKFPESLDRITARMAKMDGIGYARRNNQRQVDIALSHGLIDASPTERELTVAHELVHGLTLAELDNPSKQNIVTQLDELRQRIIDQLPKDLRDIYDQAVKTNFIDRYSAGTAPYNELTDDPVKGGIIYGLLGNDEFVSQGLTEPAFRNHLIQTKGKQNWYHRFTNLVRELLGIGERVKGTAFEEFLSHTDQLLQQGNYAAGFSNFAERFYKNLGFSDTLAQGQTQRALGLLINSGYGLSKADVFASLDNPSPVRSTEFIAARRNFTSMQLEKGDEFIRHSQLMDEMGFGPDQRGMDNFTQGVFDGDISHIDEGVSLLPEASRAMLFAKAKDYRDVLASVKAAIRSKDLIGITDPKALKPAINGALDSINNVLRLETQQESRLRQVQSLYSLDADGFYSKIARAPQPSKEIDDFADLTPVERSRFKNWFQQTGQLALENPETAEALSRGMQLAARTRNMVLQALRPFGIDLGSGQLVSKQAVKAFSKLITNNKVAAAVDKWMYLNNAKGEDKVTMLPDSDPDVQKLLTPLSEADRKNVIDTVAKQGVSVQAQHQQILDTMLQISSSRAAVIPMLDQNLKLSQGVTLASTLIEAQLSDFSDPQQASAANAKIQSVQSRMNPEAFLELLKFTQLSVEQYKLRHDYFANNPGWATAQRLERYLVKFTRGNEKKRLQASSMREANKLAQGGRDLEIVDQWKGKDDEPIELGPEKTQLFQRLHELEQNQIEMLRGKVSPDVLESIQRTSPVTQFTREIGATQGIPNFKTPPRLLSQGAEELPWLWNHLAWVNRTSNYWSRQLFRAQMEGHLMEPEISQSPKLQSDLKQHMENMLQPDPPWVSKVNKLVATWQMGLSPATAMVIGTHGLIRHTTQLTSMTGKSIDSFVRVGRALKEVTSLALGNETTEDHTWLLKQAAKDMQIEQNWHDDEALVQEQASLDFKRALMKNKPQSLGQRLESLSGSASTASMWLVQAARRTQEQIALLASFDYYREQGLTKEEARDKAYTFNQGVNPVGGRAQRPIGAFAGSDDFSRSAAMLGFNMKSYILGTIGQLARHVQGGFGRVEGLTPSESFYHKKAAVQMMGVQMAAAGLLGLPGVGAVLGLLNQLFPSFEVNKKLRETMGKFFGADENNGSVWSDTAMTGLPSMLGWDWQSRLSMSNIVPGVSENDGFQPELLLGPSVNVATNFVNGARRVATGDASGVFSFVPTGLKKLVQLASTGGTLKDYKNRPIFNPTPGESFGAALGFNPKRLADFNVASRIATQGEDVARTELGQFHQNVAEQVLKGNFGTARQQLLDRTQVDKTYDPLGGVRAVAGAAEALSFPRDLRREGQRSTSPARQRLLSALNVEPGEVNEVSRLKFRLGIQQRLGLPAAPSVQEEQVAFLMDQMKAQQPTATRAELRQQAEQLVRRQRLQTLSPLEE